jgi:cyclohexanecarboxyl-CoA dehydrogenase
MSMDFDFSADQQMFRQEIRRFAEKQLAPHYQSDDVTGRMTPSIFIDMAAVGLFGLRVPERFGGADADAVTVGIAAEEVARSNINAGYALLSTALVCDIFLSACSEEQLGQWLPPIASGAVIPTLALTEPGHGSDAANIELQAKPTADGWELNGEKTSISLTEDADHAVVFARTGQSGARGVSAFYVSLDHPAVSRTRLDDVANRAAGRCSLFFDQLPVSAEQMIGSEGSGFVSVMQGFEYSRAIIGLLALGAAGAALDDAIEYARTRNTFGAPISSRQGVAFPLVEHLTYIAGARHLCYEALWRKDRGLDHTVQANMVKWWAPKAAVEAIHQALLTFGHAAWSADNPQSQRMRDAMGFEIADGTAQIAKLVVARAVFGRQYAP